MMHYRIGISIEILFVLEYLWKYKVSLVIHYPVAVGVHLRPISWNVICTWVFSNYNLQCLKYLLNRDHFVNVPSQWKTTLHCNVLCRWFGAYIKWPLFKYIFINAISLLVSKNAPHTPHTFSSLAAYFCKELCFVSTTSPGKAFQWTDLVLSLRSITSIVGEALFNHALHAHHFR